MGFLKRAAREEDSSDESAQIEEQYMKLFPKIGRDFVHREDLESLIRQILFLIDPLEIIPISIDDSEARLRAAEYKHLLEEDKKGSDIYKDLINLDEDGE
jgi:hypothetical protein